MERSISIGPVQPRKVVKGGPMFSKIVVEVAWLRSAKKDETVCSVAQSCMKDI